MKNELPDIYGYSDFRQYLADYHKARQAAEPGFSRSEFSRSLGLPNTRSFVNDVIKGKRITPNFIERFIKALPIDQKGAQFFRTMVKFNQSENTDERELYFDQLISLNSTPKRVMEQRVYRYYRDWYNAVIRSILNVMDFSDDYTELARTVVPKITVKQAKASIKLLEELGLITKDKSGFFKPVDKVVSASDHIQNEILRQYQLKSLDIAQKAFIATSEHPKRVVTKMVTLSETGFKRVDKKLKKVSTEINSIIHKDEDKADRVYRLNLVLVPHT